MSRGLRALLTLGLAAFTATGCAAPGARPPPAPPASPASAQGTLREDGVWSGTVTLADDVLVPRGRTLRILAGTRVLVRPADTTKTEPQFLDNATELLVRGRLIVEGERDRPVSFEQIPPAPGETAGERWGGIIFDGGEGEIRHARLSGAETGFTLIGSSPALSDVAISGVRQGLAAHLGAAPRLLRVRVDAEDVGVACWPGSSPALEDVAASAGEHEGLIAAPGSHPRIQGSTFRGGVADILWGAAGAPPAGGDPQRVHRVEDPRAAGIARDWGRMPPPFEPRVPPRSEPARVYRGEQFIGEDARWEGEVLVDGTVMVAPGATLTVAPGTVVRFAFRDSDGDGLGESEIFIQGRLLAEGTPEAPIVFTALDGEGPGRWGALNIMGADAEESRLAWVLIERSFRGLHGHFSRFRVDHAIFRDNLRSIQFQESTVALADCTVTGSGSALRFRDSTAALERLVIAGNTLGVQLLRSTFSLTGSAILDNALAGLHVRESEGSVAGTRFEGNTPGLRASDCRLSIEACEFVANNGAGIQLRRTEGRVTGSRIAGNAGNGVSTDSPRDPLRRNALEGNLRFAIESNTAEPIDATENWWGPGGPAAGAIRDAADDAALGPVLTDPPLAAAPARP
ncbi:MAG TPA: right-handed parallel beta-helix repeat-containing protein [bacterium]